MMIRNVPRAPHRMPQVDMTSFLIIDRVAQFAESFYDFFPERMGSLSVIYQRRQKFLLHQSGEREEYHRVQVR
jgi:hypothetical protein